MPDDLPPSLGARVRGLFAPHRSRLVVIVALVLVGSALGVVNPFLLQRVFDEALFPPGDGGVVLPTLLVLVGLMILFPLLAAAVGVLQTDVDRGSVNNPSSITNTRHRGIPLRRRRLRCWSHRPWGCGGSELNEGAEQVDDVPVLGNLAVGETAGGGAAGDGFATDLWTLARVADVIEGVAGVRYSQTQTWTWTVLRERLGWSRQRPARRAVERDEDAIATRS